MGKITNALKKAADERVTRIEKVSRIRQKNALIVRKVGQSKIDANAVVYHDPKAVASEQYKILRTNLLSLNKGKPPRTLVVTSSIHSEGKTVTSLNLAFSLAQAVHSPKILLVDADMRKGRLDRYLGLKKKKGLSEILSGKATEDECLFNLDYDNLTFLESGAVPDNPSELLGSDSFREFLGRMKGSFDHVILDTPPIISVTDSGIAGSFADGVLMVIQAGRTQRGIVRRAEELLYQSQAKIIGHLLTNIEYHLPEYIYRYL